MKEEIKLGILARDIISGFEGIVTAISKLQYNCDRVRLEVTGNPDKVGVANWFDITSIKPLGSSQIITPPKAPVCPFKFGDKVKDTLSSFHGTVTEVASFINGCIRVGVQSPFLEKGVPVDALWYAPAQLQLVESTEEKIKSPKTGGPCSAPRQIKGTSR